MRNDIIQSKIAYDSENIYFYVKTADNLTLSTDRDWMRLLIDTDPSGISENWEGFEFLINRESPQNGKATLEKSSGIIDFEEIGKIDYTVNGNILQLSVPRTALGLTDEEVKFNFKWSDNLLGSDATAFYVNGDAAPGGRFAFVFDSTVAGETESEKTSDIFGFIKSVIQKFETCYADLRKLYHNLFR